MRAFILLTSCLMGLTLTVAPSPALSLDEGQVLAYLGAKPLSLAGQGGIRIAATRPGKVLDSFFADALGVQLVTVTSCADCADPISAAPEPTALLLFGTAMAALGLAVRRRLRRAARGNRT